MFPRAPRVTVRQGEKRGGRIAERFNGILRFLGHNRAAVVEDASDRVS